MNKIKELNRLAFGASEKTGSELIVGILVECNGNSTKVLHKTKEVIKIVIDNELPVDAPVEDWKVILPQWFVQSCSAEITKQEAEKILRTPQGYEILSNTWTVSGFVYWFRPEERSWYWWDSIIEDSNTLILQIRIDGFPFSWGALEFLLKVSGADYVKEL